MISHSLFTINPTSLLSNDAKHNENKLDRFEEMHSPSTEYTDCEQTELVDNTKVFDETLGYSAKFLQELSTFEPLIETALQYSFDFEANSQFKTYMSAKKDSFEESPVPLSRKESTEAESEGEVEVEEEAELEGWTDKKDKLLKNLAPKCKYDWKKIAKKFNDTEKSDFTPLVLKQKYKNLTKVSIPLRVKFTHQEDLMIAKYFDIYGCDWAQMATHFADRTAMMLKNRYYSHIRKRNLLCSMLNEVNEGKEDVDGSTNEEAVEESGEGMQLAVEDNQGIAFRKFSYSNFNNIFYEVDNELNAELHDRITF